MVAIKLKSNLQFKLIMLFAQLVGVALAAVYLFLIGPNNKTDSLTLLTLYAQAPIAVFSFGAFYNYVIGTTSFRRWRSWTIALSLLGVATPLLGFAQIKQAFPDGVESYLILAAFCISAGLNASSSVLIVRLASFGYPNWFAGQSILGSLALTTSLILPISRTPLVIFVLLIFSSVTQFILVRVRHAKLINVDLNSVKSNGNFSMFTFQCLRSLVGYAGPIFLLVALSEIEGGIITIVSIISKVVQAIINWSANAKVHTSTNMIKRSTYGIEAAMRRYLFIFQIVLVSTLISNSIHDNPLTQVLFAAELWAIICICEIVTNRQINLNSSQSLIIKCTFGGAFGFTVAAIALEFATSVPNYYLFYGGAIAFSSIVPGWSLLSTGTKRLCLLSFISYVLLSSFNPLLSLSIAFINLYFSAKLAIRE